MENDKQAVLQEKKAKAVSQYLAADKEYGGKDFRTQLFYCAVQVSVLAEAKAQEAEKAEEVAKTLDELAQSIEVVNKDAASQSFRSFWAKLVRDSGFVQGIKIPSFLVKYPELKNKLFGTLGVLQKLLSQCGINEYDDVYAYLLPDCIRFINKKKKNAFYTELQRQTTEAVEIGKQEI